jgi:hypothetical protein
MSAWFGGIRSGRFHGDRPHSKNLAVIAIFGALSSCPLCCLLCVIRRDRP